MLARAGVDYSTLTITDDPDVWTDVETGVSSTSVRIEGPKEARHLAASVLYGKYLGNAAYPEHDMWTRA